MAEGRVERRLAAILAADVVGYSRLMGEDEAGTLARLKSLRAEAIDPKVAAYGGRIVKSMGDGLLIEFPSAVDAVGLAVEMQADIAGRNAGVPEERRLRFRIGINIGDVIVDGGDIFGDGVNVAARLEEQAEPGGILVSGLVQESVRNRLEVAFEDRGERSLKNIANPVRVFGIAVPTGDVRQGAPAAADALFRKPAVAVLPFANMSGDAEQEYFADGLTEDIITALSRWRSFPVIARNSTFAYKGQSPDIREVGKALGARYVVEGSVRKAGNRVRVTAQLINSDTGHHVWAERYDRDLDDIFALQDEMTDRIAAIVEPAIAGAEVRQLAARPPRELSVWDLCIQGQHLIYEGTKESNRKARDKFNRAIEIDPDYARAWAGLAYTHMHDVRLRFTDSREESLKSALDAARRAVAADESDAEARTMLARTLNASGRTENGLAEIRRALELNPQNTSAIMTIAVIRAFKQGAPEEGIGWFERTLEINPNDPRNYIIKTHLAVAHICAGNYEQAAELARDATGARADYIESHAALASALGHLGRVEEAAQAAENFRDRVGEYAETYPIWDQSTKDIFLAGLRKAKLID